MAIRAEILTLGRELLIGKTVNTNASWIAGQLTFMGIRVERIVVAPDSVCEISETINYSLKRGVDILIVTGGLGSTYDDLTVDGLASALHLPKEINMAALALVEAKYRSLGMEMTPTRLKMAIFPEGSMPLPNESGSAPGLFIEARGTMIFCLPGVPSEMKQIFQSEVLRMIKEKAPRAFFIESSFTVEGMPESTLAPIIEEWMPRGRQVYLKSHPSGGEGRPAILVHLSATGSDPEKVRKEIKAAERNFAAMVERRGGRVRKG